MRKSLVLTFALILASSGVAFAESQSYYGNSGITAHWDNGFGATGSYGMPGSGTVGMGNNGAFPPEHHHNIGAGNTGGSSKDSASTGISDAHRSQGMAPSGSYGPAGSGTEGLRNNGRYQSNG